MTKESPFWTIFGKASAVITTIAAIVGIWVVVNQPNEDLELHAEFRPYTISPDLKDAISNNFKSFSYSTLKDSFKKGTPK